MRRQELILFIGIIVFLGIVFLGYILVSLFSPSRPPTHSPNPSLRPGESFRPFDRPGTLPSTPPSPAPLPSTLPSSAPGEPTKQSLIDQMPVQTEFADIEYLSAGDTFVVTIKQNPYQENKAKVEAWFNAQGFNPTALKIYWQSYPEVIRE